MLPDMQLEECPLCPALNFRNGSLAAVPQATFVGLDVLNLQPFFVRCACVSACDVSSGPVSLQTLQAWGRW
jgi:hypothetical protein